MSTVRSHQDVGDRDSEGQGDVGRTRTGSATHRNYEFPSRQHFRHFRQATAMSKTRFTSDDGGAWGTPPVSSSCLMKGHRAAGNASMICLKTVKKRSVILDWVVSPDENCLRLPNHPLADPFPRPMASTKAATTVDQFPGAGQPTLENAVGQGKGAWMQRDSRRRFGIFTTQLLSS